MTGTITTTEPDSAETLIDGRYRLIECMKRSGDAGVEHCLTWRAYDEQLHRDVRLEVISAPADASPDAEVMLVSRCLSPSAVLDAGDWDGSGSVFLVTAFTSLSDAPAARAKRARRRLFTRARMDLRPVSANSA